MKLRRPLLLVIAATVILFTLVVIGARLLLGPTPDGHTGTIGSVVFSTDGKYALT